MSGKHQTRSDREKLLRRNLERMLPGNRFTVRLSEGAAGEEIDVDWTGPATRAQVAHWLNESSAVGAWEFDK